MKIRRPADAPPERSGVRPRAFDKAKEAAIERKLSQYIDLECTHLTTWEADEAYSAWRPRKNQFFCEVCGAWRVRLHKPKPPRLPDEPLF